MLIYFVAFLFSINYATRDTVESFVTMRNVLLAEQFAHRTHLPWTGCLLSVLVSRCEGLMTDLVAACGWNVVASVCSYASCLFVSMWFCQCWRKCNFWGEWEWDCGYCSLFRSGAGECNTHNDREDMTMTTDMMDTLPDDVIRLFLLHLSLKELVAVEMVRYS